MNTWQANITNVKKIIIVEEGALGARGNEWMLLASFLSGLWASIVEVMSLYIRQRKKSVIFITMQSEETWTLKISGMKKFDLNKRNILAQEYYVDLRQKSVLTLHVDMWISSLLKLGIELKKVLNATCRDTWLLDGHSKRPSPSNSFSSVQGIYYDLWRLPSSWSSWFI